MSINLYGPLNDLGYGIFTRGIAKGLYDIGYINFHLNPIGQIGLESNEDVEMIQRNSQISWSRQNDAVAIWHEFDLSRFSGKRLFAFPIFETTEFVQAGKSYLSQMDGILVASRWAKEVVQQNTNNSVPVYVAPGGCELMDSEAIRNTKQNSVFTFLSIGKLEERKGHFDLMQAYFNGFSDFRAETRLLLHCFNPLDKDFLPKVHKMLVSLGANVRKSVSNNCLIAQKNKAIIEIPMGRLSRENLFQLFKFSHIGVFPAKAEGWNLPLMEALQSGLPCIATNYSAHTEYLNEENNYNKDLLLTKLTEVKAFDGIYFHGNRGNWMSTDQEELIEKMRNSYNNYDSILNAFNPQIFRDKYTWSNTASKLIEALSK